MKRPQRNYVRHHQVVYQVWDRFEQAIATPVMTHISREFHVPARTLRDWYKKYQSDPNWRPYDTSVHGEHHRIFTKEEEDAITNYIVENFFRPGFAFHDADFQFIAMSAFLEKYQGKECPEFQCSPGFIADFKARNNLATRKAHFKRRPAVLPDTDAWVGTVRELLERVPHDRVINCDETAWRILPAGCTTWAKKGADNIAITTADGEKDCLTVLASVTASGVKLPLLIVAKGLTERCEHSQLGDIYPHYSCHTTTGWINESCFRKYLEMLREHFRDNDPIYLILDVYPAHRVVTVKELAERLNIHLLFLPAGLTDKYQPLDRRVFGALKANMKRHVYQFMSDNPGQKIVRRRAVQYLIECWKHLTQDAINSAWSVYVS